MVHGSVKTRNHFSHQFNNTHLFKGKNSNKFAPPGRNFIGKKNINFVSTESCALMRKVGPENQDQGE